MLKAFKTEIDPTDEQKDIIARTIGTCRFVYNFYISHNQEIYGNTEEFMTGREFSVWLNNEFLPGHSEKAWIKDVSSKSVKKSIEDGYKAFINFFKGRAGFPKRKKKGKSDPKMYFVRNNPGDCICERHRIKIPTLGWMRLKEKGYVPVTGKGYKIKSGTVSIRAGRYYVSVLIEMPEEKPLHSGNPGIGIDLGIKDLAVVSDGTKYKNINKTPRIKKIEKRLKRAQKSLSRKYGNKRKGWAAQYKNIDKQRLKVQRLHQRLDNIRTDYTNQVIAGIVKTKPSYIAIEDLNVSGMMKNRHLSKAIASQKLYEFRSKIIGKGHQKGIEIRTVHRFYPSSKLCHACGRLKTCLKLSDRMFECECGYREDRDYNASLNLRDAEVYTVA